MIKGKGETLTEKIQAAKTNHAALLVLYEDQLETSTKLGALVAEMLKALEAAEWGGRIQDDEACPVCDMNSYSGHHPDCILASALKKAKGE